MIDDDKKNTSPDDEYQFPKEEYTSQETSHEENASSLADPPLQKNKWLKYIYHFPQLKNKRVGMVVLIVIVLIILFHFINSAKKTAAPSESSPQQVTAQPQNTNLTNSINALQEHGSRTESEIGDLKAQLSDVQTNLSQVQATNQQLQTSVETLTTQMEDLSVVLNKLLAKKRPGPKVKPLVFHLRAVVPDRAWVTSNQGKTVSVTVGDRLKQYGVVRSIDAERGMITTSSGRDIKYGSNDH